MPGMSRDDIREFRRKMAEFMITLQNDAALRFDKASVIPNMVAGLLSLACFIARKNANMARADLERVCEAAIDEQYERHISKFDRWTS
jgi:hypothetical protein